MEISCKIRCRGRELGNDGQLINSHSRDKYFPEVIPKSPFLMSLVTTYFFSLSLFLFVNKWILSFLFFRTDLFIFYFDLVPTYRNISYD